MGCLLLFALAAGCGAERKAHMAAPDGVEQPKAAPEAGGRDEQAQAKGGEKAVSPRKIIYTADVRLTVEDFAKAEQQLEELLDAHKGHIVKSAIQGSPGARRSGEWKVRVPVESYRKFQAALIKLGELQSSTLDSQDVTEEFYDLETRIKNRLAAEATLRGMYDKAKTIQEMIPINDKLREVRLEIEREQGRLHLLAKLTAMTTVTIHLQERGKFVPPEAASFGTRVDRTFSESTGALGQFAEGVALLAVRLAPWLPLIAVVAVPSWFLWRRHQRRVGAIVTLAEAAPPPRSQGPSPEARP